MVEYQTILKKPPTMDEIARGIPSLNWRSSVRYVINSLLEAGHLTIVAPARCGRRYKVNE